MMPPAPLSILMAVRNGEAHLPATLVSLREQTFQNFECIFVDDASNDATPDLLRAFAASRERVQVLTNDRALNLAASLNKGLEKCSAPLVARLDGDDVCHADRLQKQVDFLRDHSEIGVLSCGFRRIDEQGRVFFSETPPTTHDVISFALMLQTPILHPGVMARKAPLEAAGGYNEDCWTAQDSELWLRLRSETKFANLPDALMDYRRHDQATTRARGQAGEAFSAAIKRPWLEAYLGRQISSTEMISALRLFKSGRFPELSELGTSIDLLDAILERTKTEPAAVRQWFVGEYRKALIAQSELYRVAGKEKTSLDLAFRALKLKPGAWPAKQLLRTAGSLARVARGKSAPVRPPSLPNFEGRMSSHHRTTTVENLRSSGTRAFSSRKTQFKDLTTFVQFVGFPRSGHSLVGALLGAHPNVLISHELDVMGLLRNGLSRNEIFGLIAENSAEFERNGSWWNGISYALDFGAKKKLRVVGDKKGDWAVRHIEQEPSLFGLLGREIPLRHLFFCVTRNPFDNISVMSLRQGRLYDRLRIEAPDSKTFRRNLAHAQAQGSIANEVSTEMISDYSDLCKGCANLAAQVGEEDFVTVPYELFTARPREWIARLCNAAAIPSDEAYLDACSEIVHISSGKPRHKLRWSAAQVEAVERLVEEYEFLSGYSWDQ